MNALYPLQNLVLAPYILKAMALIRCSRLVGGNQFRHGFSTLGILLDYKYFANPVLLKAALLHDLFEELPETQIDEIRTIDADGPGVVNMVLELTRRKDESKRAYLERLLKSGSADAKRLKCADRISNLTDLHRDTHSEEKITAYLEQTEELVLPMAREVDPYMAIELADLIDARRKHLGSIDKN